jgi:hypothetical protein
MDGPDSPNHARTFLVPYESSWLAAYHQAAGLKRLNPIWAKVEIVGGLGAVAFGLRLLLMDSASASVGGLLLVLGLYLAMAGHRSHLYQSSNRQVAYMLQMLERATRSRPL